MSATTRVPEAKVKGKSRTDSKGKVIPTVKGASLKSCGKGLEKGCWRKMNGAPDVQLSDCDMPCGDLLI